MSLRIYREPVSQTLSDTPVGSVWLCLPPDRPGFCAAMVNRFGEVIRLNPEDPVSWFTSTFKPHSFELVEQIGEGLGVDFSRIKG